MPSKVYYNEAHNKATQKYIHKTYDQCVIRLRKDGDLTRKMIDDAARDAGMSTSAYFVEAVREKMVRQGILQKTEDMVE